MVLNLVLLAGLMAQTPSAPAKAPAAAKPAAKTPAVEREPGLYVTFDVVHGTEPMGKIVCKFFEKESPITVKNFTDLARGLKVWRDPKTGQSVKRPLYNGLTFHRVIPGFMIQGGDPMGTGMGGTEPIKDEFDLDLKFDRPGLLAMANAGPNTGSSQFFITEKPTPHLTGKHTIFAEVVEGQSIVENVARVPRDDNDKPQTPVIMRRVTIERFPKPAPAPAAKPKPAGSTQKKAAPAKPRTSTAPKTTTSKPSTTQKK